MTMMAGHGMKCHCTEWGTEWGHRVDLKSAQCVAPPVLLPASPEFVPPESSSLEPSSPESPRRPDPITQGLTLLATVGLMLLAARFVIPQVVEEIRYAWHRGELRAEYETGMEGLKNVSLEALSDAYELVSATVGPSVVHIDVSRRLPIDHLEGQLTLSVWSLPPTREAVWWWMLRASS